MARKVIAVSHHIPTFYLLFIITNSPRGRFIMFSEWTLADIKITFDITSAECNYYCKDSKRTSMDDRLVIFLRLHNFIEQRVSIQ